MRCRWLDQRCKSRPFTLTAYRFLSIGHLHATYASAFVHDHLSIHSTHASPSTTDDTRYATLGPHWSATMLSLIEFAMIPIPIVFYRYGRKIREKSALIRQMREDRDKLDSRKRKAAERVARRDVEEIGGEKKALEV